MREKFVQLQLDGGVLKILMIDSLIVSYAMMLQLVQHLHKFSRNIEHTLTES